MEVSIMRTLAFPLPVAFEGKIRTKSIIWSCLSLIFLALPTSSYLYVLYSSFHG